MTKPMHDLVIGGDFTIPNYAMVSGEPPAEEGHKIAVGKSGRIWLYTPDRSRVYVSGGKGSRGFGGSTVNFKLADGLGSIDLVGPWASNADAFFKDTSIDVRQNFVTWGCVGTGREYSSNTGETRITGVLWFDAEPVKGAFDRVDFVAWEMQEKSDVPLYCYSESEGGSSHGPVSMPYQMRIAKGLQKEIDW